MTTYLLNVLPSQLLSHASHLQILYQRKPSYSHIRCLDVYVFPYFRQLLRLFGVPSKIIIYRHVTFDETKLPFSTLNSPTTHTYDFLDEGLSP